MFKYNYNRACIYTVYLQNVQVFGSFSHHRLQAVKQRIMLVNWNALKPVYYSFPTSSKHVEVQVPRTIDIGTGVGSGGRWCENEITWLPLTLPPFGSFTLLTFSSSSSCSVCSAACDPSTSGFLCCKIIHMTLCIHFQQHVCVFIFNNQVLVCHT